MRHSLRGQWLTRPFTALLLFGAAGLLVMALAFTTGAASPLPHPRLGPAVGPQVAGVADPPRGVVAPTDGAANPTPDPPSPSPSPSPHHRGHHGGGGG